MGKVITSHSPRFLSISERPTSTYHDHPVCLEDRIRKLNQICRRQKERQQRLQSGVSTEEILEILREEQRRLEAALSDD